MNLSTNHLKAACVAALFVVGALRPTQAETVDYTTSITQEFPCPKEGFWFQARAESIPREILKDSGASGPRVLLTMQLHGMKGTHNYKGIVSAYTDDLGKIWQGPTAHDELDLRVAEDNGSRYYEVPVDATPIYHPQTQKVLLVGATFHVDTKTNKDVPGGASDVFYAVYDPKTEKWDTWQRLDFPKSFKWPYKRAGCVQCIVQPNGEVLMPIYFGEHNNSIHYSAVARCAFDGEKLTYQEHGSEHVVDNGRGMSEPSIACFEGKYFLTMRNDHTAYVSTSSDGLNYTPHEKWRFDDGEELGSYNTQQHFLTHSDALFLVYTRRGLDNDDVMRHRAPLVMAQIDPATSRVLRDTERIVVPKQGSAAMGNFGTCNVSPGVSWIVVAHRTTTPGDKNVAICQIEWKQPNELVAD
ncbi:sialidase family protein [Aeoliella sp.]|uniref:sialidase family protein n=1 Tax=Aeoliella sp. TaxID=2795800 RepID=UPI003CCC4175